MALMSSSKGFFISLSLDDMMTILSSAGEHSEIIRVSGTMDDKTWLLLAGDGAI